MMDESKVAVVRGYLRQSFPNCAVHDTENFDRIAQEFRINDKQSGVMHKVIVSSEFLEDNTAANIGQKLASWKLADTIGKAGGSEVSVTNEGVRVDK